MFLGLPWTEWLGYAASLVVAIALLMRSLIRLRWINLFGSALFAVYGFLIGAWPVAGFNTVIVFINIWFLVKMYGTRETFELMPLQPGDPYLKRFLTYYQEDLIRIFPQTASQFLSPTAGSKVSPGKRITAPTLQSEQSLAEHNLAEQTPTEQTPTEQTLIEQNLTEQNPESLTGFYMLRDLTTAGIFLGKRIEPDALEVLVDYATPAYRDFKTGRFLYHDSAETWHQHGIRTLRAYAADEAHARYLLRMGFTKQENQYVLNV